MLYISPFYFQVYDGIAKVVAGLITVCAIIPIVMYEIENCEEDEDCPFIMRCCVYGTTHYCCRPNNYVNFPPSYLYLPVYKDNS